MTLSAKVAAPVFVAAAVAVAVATMIALGTHSDAGSGRTGAADRDGATPTQAPRGPARPGDPGTPSPGPVPRPPTMPVVTYTMSGDLAGRVLHVSIGPAGHWTRSESRQDRTSGDLTGARVRALAALLSDPVLAGEARLGGPKPGGACADFPTRTLTTGGITIRSGCRSPRLPAFETVARAITNYTGG